METERRGKMAVGESKSRVEVEEIPEPVAVDILSKLPVKSLVRFRCVCKHWSCSFQTSRFITKHLHNNVNNNNNNHLNLLLKRRQRKYDTLYQGQPTLDIKYYFSALSTQKGRNFEVEEDIIHLPCIDHLYASVCGTCNGLLCLCLGNDGQAVALWNPSTREFKTIRPFEDRFCICCLGFGFDSTSNDYKVVRFVTSYECVFYPNGKFRYQVELYSLKSDSWKEISAPDLLSELHGFNRYVNCYVNGVCYWRALKGLQEVVILSLDMAAEGLQEVVILSFDMAAEKFSTLPSPIGPAEHSTHDLQLLDFNGSLGAIVYPWKRSDKSFDLWVINGSGSWTKQFSINEPIPGVERPLGFWKNGEIFLESSEKNELVLFDPATKEVKNLGVASFEGTMQVIAYVESLVLINGRSEKEEHIQRGQSGGIDQEKTKGVTSSHNGGSGTYP